MRNNDPILERLKKLRDGYYGPDQSEEIVGIINDAIETIEALITPAPDRIDWHAMYCTAEEALRGLRAELATAKNQPATIRAERQLKYARGLAAVALGTENISDVRDILERIRDGQL